MNLDPAIFKRRFEYLLEDPQLADFEVEKQLVWCNEHRHFIASVATNHSLLTLAARLLRGSGILPSAGISYPLGGLPLELAIHEAQEAIRLGARQVELVLPAGRMRGGEMDAVQGEIQEFCSQVGHDCAVILVANLALLENEQKAWSARLASRLGVSLRTNTGYDTFDTIEDIRLVCQAGKSKLAITACGGVNTAERAIDLLQAGAAIIATSQLPSVIEGIETLVRYQKKERS